MTHDTGLQEILQILKVNNHLYKKASKTFNIFSTT